MSRGRKRKVIDIESETQEISTAAAAAATTATATAIAAAAPPTKKAFFPTPDQSLAPAAEIAAADNLTQACLDCRSKLENCGKKYQVIYADPPWFYFGRSQHIAGKTPYPTMTTRALCELPVAKIAEKDCALFLWVTCPLMEDAMQIIKAWGFKFITVFKTWRKVYANGEPVAGLGHWTRGNIELLLVATKGTVLKNWRTTRSMLQEFTGPRLGHSTKPPEIRNDVEKFLNVDRRIELFARQIIPNWDAWGLEVPNYFHHHNHHHQSQQQIEDNK